MGAQGRAGRPERVDRAVAGALFTVLLGVSYAQVPHGVPLWVRLPVIAAMTLPLVVRRRWPGPVLGVVAGAAGAGALGAVVHEPFTAVAFALYGAAAGGSGGGSGGRLPVRALGAGCALLALLAVVAGSPAAQTAVIPYYVLGVAFCGMAWTAGSAVRERRTHAARAARQLAERAVTEERLRIARELHDVVAHHVGVIAVQAAVANHVLAVRPEQAGAALSVIETSGRHALAEMRQMLGVLRTGADGPDEGAGADGVTPAPPSGLAHLPGLLERAAAAGVLLTTALPHAGELDGLPEGVDRSAYRLVQEALTNVIRHAAPTRCAVVLEATGGALRIEVTDEGGPGRGAGGGTGTGLIGMRERVALYGGEFHAGPRAGGGFRVRALLPWEVRG